MIYGIEDNSTIYCVLSVYQTLFVSKPSGALGSDCDKGQINGVGDGRKVRYVLSVSAHVR